jgi:hypothetical protein
MKVRDVIYEDVIGLIEFQKKVWLNDLIKCKLMTKSDVEHYFKHAKGLRFLYKRFCDNGEYIKGSVALICFEGEEILGFVMGSNQDDYSFINVAVISDSPNKYEINKMLLDEYVKRVSKRVEVGIFDGNYIEKDLFTNYGFKDSGIKSDWKLNDKKTLIELNYKYNKTG